MRFYCFSEIRLIKRGRQKPSLRGYEALACCPRPPRTPRLLGPPGLGPAHGCSPTWSGGTRWVLGVTHKQAGVLLPACHPSPGMEGRMQPPCCLLWQGTGLGAAPGTPHVWIKPMGLLLPMLVAMQYSWPAQPREPFSAPLSDGTF